ncbi:unnamed protein product [Schistosoma rodhaini]|uniref:NUFIP1 domain-containing protein n=1 Tax=Schistosoma mansoni TaxID=6183 RepID=A0A5K4FEF9_SCHMA|nr:unnamed protein product [Schistosoma rodhaini]
MELPPFELLYTTSDILNELENALEELDQNKLFKDVGRRRRQRRNGGLYGVGFEAEEPDYFNPVGICCDIAFYTNEEYRRHLDSHVKCPVEGCPFMSHPKAMRVHQEVIHNSGLFNTIYRETCDKSVKVWRESRRRNYPTLERVEAKKKLIEERIERGEIFETPQFGSMNKPNSNVLRSSQINEVDASSNKMSTSSKKTGKISKQCKTNSSSSVVTNRESNIRLVSMDYDSESTDNDNITIKDKSSCDIIDPTTESVEKPNNTASGRRRKRGRKQKSDNTTTSDNPINENTEDSQNNPFASHPLVKLQVKRRQCLSNIHSIHSRPTLLQMLLAEDIRKERNQLMQCIRYIVKENFFQ